ncbi:MAG: hypothetical protein ACHQXA_03025 [Gemmatimonadales bacterium]|jgi:hypothetical protein
MNWSPAHFHLLVNHLPILGAPFVLLLLLWGMLARSRDLTRAALWLTLPLALAGFVADQSGDSAKHALRSASWVERPLVEEHEHRADLAEIGLYAAAAAGVLALWWGRTRPADRWPAGLTAAVLFVAALLAAWTGLAGGVIRHTEIRTEVPALSAPLPAPGVR